MPFARARADRPPLDAEGLMELAVKSLGSRMKSERDLRRKLAERAEPGEPGEEQVAAVIARLKELGYLSDERFAADYTRLRQENQSLGRRRVQQGLMVKGIAAPLVERTLTEAYEQVDELALALQFAERKRLKAPDDPDREKRQKEGARVVRRLLAGGFSSQVAFQVLRQLGADAEEMPSEAALEGSEEIGDAS